MSATLDDPSEIEPVIAGTLALMTHYPTRQCTCIAEKIRANLELLATCAHLSPPLRNLCERLKRDWDQNIAARYGEIVAHQREHAVLH